MCISVARCVYTSVLLGVYAHTPSNTDVDNLNTDTHRPATLHTYQVTMDTDTGNNTLNCALNRMDFGKAQVH